MQYVPKWSILPPTEKPTGLTSTTSMPFYQKITDIYAQCSVDYDKDAEIFSPLLKQDWHAPAQRLMAI